MPIEKIKAATKLPGIEASLSDRWAVLGITGSGKTTFGKQLLQRLRASYPGVRTYILDSQDAGDFDDIPGVRVASQGAPTVLKSGGQIQIWQPPLNDIAEYHTWFSRILRDRKPSVVLIDELASLSANKPNTFPMGYALLQKQGRKLEICVISHTQEAAYIPRQTLGQLTHLVRFRLENEHDKRLAARKLNIEHTAEPRNAYGFFYRRTDRPGSAHEYRDWQDFLK